MLLACSYKEKEFIRVGYYVNNDYAEEEMRENPPAVPELQKIQRHILAEKPRVCTICFIFLICVITGYQICNTLG